MEKCNKDPKANGYCVICYPDHKNNSLGITTEFLGFKVKKYTVDEVTGLSIEELSFRAI